MPFITHKAGLFMLVLVLISPGSAANYLDKIQLLDTRGKPHSLGDYIGKGKWVVLNIWGPGCPPCEEEMPELVRFHDAHASAGGNAMVLGIAIGFPGYDYADASRVQTFMEEYLIDFPVLLSDGSITGQMGLGELQGVPTTYVFTPQGEIAGMQVGAITQAVLDRFIEEKTRTQNNADDRQSK